MCCAALWLHAWVECPVHPPTQRQWRHQTAPIDVAARPAGVARSGLLLWIRAETVSDGSSNGTQRRRRRRHHGNAKLTTTASVATDYDTTRHDRTQRRFLLCVLLVHDRCWIAHFYANNCVSRSDNSGHAQSVCSVAWKLPLHFTVSPWTTAPVGHYPAFIRTSH